MKCFKVLPLLVVLGVASIASADPVPKQWQKIYASISKNIEHNDVPGYMKWMDKGFVNLQDGKKTGYAAYQKVFTDFLKPFTNIKSEARPLDFKQRSRDVVIVFHYTFSGDLSQKGKTRTIRFYEDGVDTWRGSNGKYLQVFEDIKKSGLLPA